MILNFKMHDFYFIFYFIQVNENNAIKRLCTIFGILYPYLIILKKMSGQRSQQLKHYILGTKISGTEISYTKLSSYSGLRTRNIFNRVQVRVRVHKKIASPSSSSSSQNRAEKIQPE